MKKILSLIKVVFVTFLTVIPVSTSFAGSDLNITVPENLFYNGAADGMSFGDEFGSGSSGDGRVCHNNDGGWIFKEAYIRPVLPGMGSTIVKDGITYEIFESGAQGVGWIMSVKDSNAYQPSPLTAQPVKWLPVPGTPAGPFPTIGGRAAMTLLKTNTHLTEGVYIIPAQNLAILECFNNAGAVADYGYIRLIAPVSITITSTGCEITSPANAVIDFGEFNASDFPSVGSKSQPKNFTISLECDPGVNLHATVSDQTDRSNRTDTVQLSADSTAKGLGVQAVNVNTGTPFMLGPDDSSSGSQNQFFLQNTGSGGLMNFPVDFQYIRTGELAGGSANALIGITFSYQ